MSDENVVEIDFDDNTEVLDTSSVDLPPMDQPQDSTLRIGLVGSGTLAESVRLSLAYPAPPAKVEFYQFDDIDDAVANDQVHLFFVTTEVEIMKDDIVDDAVLVDQVNKLSKTKASVCVKSTINLETLNRLLQVIPADRLVYSPELVTDMDMKDIIRSDTNIIGGTPTSTGSYNRLMQGQQIFDRKNVVLSFKEAVVLKLAVSAKKAVVQTFHNQLHAYAQDADINYNIISKTLANVVDHAEDSIPTHLRAIAEGASVKRAKSFSGEYANRDIRVFASETDKLPLLDECINYKNLKD